MNALIIGSTAGIGRSIAECLANAGYNLFLVSSDERDLVPQASDLSLRFNINTHWLSCNLSQDSVEKIYLRYNDVFENINLLLSVAGYGDPKNDTGNSDNSFVSDIININYASHVKIINLFINKLLETKDSICLGIGSVSTSCPKSDNIIYSSSKKGLEHYFSCLMRRYTLTQCKFQFYRMGFVKTSLLSKSNSFIPAVSPNYIARKIISNTRKKAKIYYLPLWWQPLMKIYKIYQLIFHAPGKTRNHKS